MGGGDKTALDLGAGRSVLDHLVSGFERSVPVVVVGPRHALERSVRWTRESPPGGGPLAGLAAGLAALPAGLSADLAGGLGSSNGAAGAAGTGPATWVVVVAGDQPFASLGVGPLLTVAAAVGEEVDAVVGQDDAGRLQPLLAAYRASALRARLGDPESADPSTTPTGGRSMHSLLEHHDRPGGSPAGVQLARRRRPGLARARPRGLGRRVGRRGLAPARGGDLRLGPVGQHGARDHAHRDGD